MCLHFLAVWGEISLFDSDYRTHQEVTLRKESMSNLSIFLNSLSLSLSLFRQVLLLWLLASLFVGFCGFGFLASVFFLAVWLLASGFSGIGGIGG